MMSTLLVGLLGATVFVEQPMPELAVGSLDLVTGLSPVNTVPGDADRDGATDLLLPTSVFLQRDGGYSIRDRVTLPEGIRSAPAVLHDGHVFAFPDGSVHVYAYGDRSFLAAGRTDVAADEPSAGLFLHDFNGDGTRELGVATPSGLAVVSTEFPFDILGRPAIYPPVRPRLAPARSLWGPRRETEPDDIGWVHDFALLSRGDVLTVMERLRPDDRMLFYRTYGHRFAAGPEGGIESHRVSGRISGSLPDGTVTMRTGNVPPALVRIDDVDPLAIPPADRLYDVWLSQDFGETWSQVRVKAGTNQIAFADVDGDGDRDLVSSHGDLFDAPIREVVSALASDRRIEVTVLAHVQRRDGTLARTPRRLFTTAIDLERPAIRGGPRWESYWSGNLFSATADLNGDGRTDIVAWERPGRVAIYLNEEGIFRTRPDARLSTPDYGRLFTADVDHDGRADVVILPDGPERGGRSPAIVYFSREEDR